MAFFGTSPKAAELADEITDFTAVRGRSLFRDA
ncbi:MAG: peptide ABC transporter permease, partial [Pelagibaca sp.]|nr:peptide ABC transporter permease [Pelagibaca sp.]